MLFFKLLKSPAVDTRVLAVKSAAWQHYLALVASAGLSYGQLALSELLPHYQISLFVFSSIFTFALVINQT